MNQDIMTMPEMMKQGFDYCIDFTQRAVLLTDIMRKRGNNYLRHLSEGQPSVMVFDYKTIINGKKFDRPVNYELVRIIDRREKKPAPEKIPIEKRFHPKHYKSTGPDPFARPIVIIDPRAGHGPGIAGSKLDSQIGVALNAGHPVYFMLFFTEPVPGQTIADVQKAHVRFIEEIAHLHPKAGKPAIIGNCQAGWAAALIGADRPDITGPMVFNGSPLSYWGGVRGANPMRYRGGLFGGAWLASFGSDLGNGRFDGAHLVAGFESLNPANTYWSKLYNVFSKVDTEENRFLSFEKWWGGFFLLSSEEIHFIVNNLFISDELEQGFLKLQEGSYINLKRLKEPILVFASRGDNITPPQQALNWISKVYKTVEEIKRCEQVIVYLLHETIGHLGIFVSAKVNIKEHKKIINCIDAIGYLSPGLYEMVIKKNAGREWKEVHLVEFQKRSMEDIMENGNEMHHEAAFHSVSAISKFNDKAYQDFISPWIRIAASAGSSELLRQLHPLRIQRYGFSDLNPFMMPFSTLGTLVKENRKPTEKNNLFARSEQFFSQWITTGLNYYQQTRDDFQEFLFYSMYENPWIKTLFYNPEKEIKAGKADHKIEKSLFFQEIEDELWETAMKKGGFKEAVIRIVVAIIHANHVFDMREFKVAEKCILADPRLKKIKPPLIPCRRVYFEMN